MQFLLLGAIILALISAYYSYWSVVKDLQKLQQEEAENLTFIGRLLAEEAQLYLTSKRSPHQILLERRYADESWSNN